MKKKRKKRSEIRNIAEYVVLSGFMSFAAMLPAGAIKGLSDLIGDMFYSLVGGRREVAIENLRHAFKNEKSMEEIRTIARGSCRSFILTPLEVNKLRHLYKRPDAMERMRQASDDLDRLFQKAKDLHDEANGCIFVTPHLGNWELLPHACSLCGIPLSFVARPLDNPYLERLLYEKRVSTGQAIIPTKRNALMLLHRTLNQGRSVGILPDQSTNKGLSADFFGRTASTTPVPAMLAVSHQRPVVVVACCRKDDMFTFDGFVSDPIWPRENKSLKDEILRITNAVNAEMESIIRKYPEQYLWVHKRWKVYEGRKVIFSSP